MIPSKIDLQQAFSSIPELWSPRVAAQVNGCEVRLARIEGEFCWHHHENEDELFWVVRGSLELQFRDHTVQLEPGQMQLVPRGVEHRPVAHEETWIVLIEPGSTRNTGNVTSDRTVQPKQL